MSCCQAEGIEEFMDKKVAARDLKRYRKKGPLKTTLMLLNALKSEGTAEHTLLDIGGGVGILQFELLKDGLSGITSVDASSAYLKTAREEAERLGHSNLIEQIHGDFVQLADKLNTADIVTLDRVICCYDDMESLVRLSAARAGKLYGVIYPVNNRMNNILTFLGNLYSRIKGSQFRLFIHPAGNIRDIILEEGLECCFDHRTMFWHIQVYRRNTITN